MYVSCIAKGTKWLTPIWNPREKLDKLLFNETVCAFK
jgi:hypothetical protein